MACRSLLTSEFSATRRHYLELSTLEVHPPTKTKSLSRAVPRGMVLSPSRQLSNCHFKVSKNSGNCLLRTDAGDKIIIVKVKYSSRKRSCLGASKNHLLKGFYMPGSPFSPKESPNGSPGPAKNIFRKWFLLVFTHHTQETGYPCAWVSF